MQGIQIDPRTPVLVGYRNIPEEAEDPRFQELDDEEEEAIGEAAPSAPPNPEDPSQEDDFHSIKTWTTQSEGEARAANRARQALPLEYNPSSASAPGRL